MGPQAENATWTQEKIIQIFNHWFEWRRSLFPKDGVAITLMDQNSPHFKHERLKLEREIFSLLEQLKNEVPTFTPRYIGHMLSEISLPALFGSIITLLHNPNNASIEVSKIAQKLERKSIEELCKMIGLNNGYGHFTSGGTVANFEAIRRSLYRFEIALALALVLRRRNIPINYYQTLHLSWSEIETLRLQYQIKEQDLESHRLSLIGPWEVKEQVESSFQFDFRPPVLLIPGNKHYSWLKATQIFNLGQNSFWQIDLDSNGRLSIDSFKALTAKAIREKRPILLVVSVAGSTELGEIDPIHLLNQEILNLNRNKSIHLWHHCDAAYGGYYASLAHQKQTTRLSKDSCHAIKAISQCHSVTIDPHKLGYSPYSSGAILVKDKLHHQVPPIPAAYLKHKEDIWTYTLEGSRSAAGAISTWLTTQTIGLNEKGLGRILEKGLEARELMAKKLQAVDKQIRLLHSQDTNILCFCLAENSDPLSRVNHRTQKLFDIIASSPKFSVTKTALKMSAFHSLISDMTSKWNAPLDSDELFLIRIVLMNPFIISNEMNVNYFEEFAHFIAQLIIEL